MYCLLLKGLRFMVFWLKEPEQMQYKARWKMFKKWSHLALKQHCSVSLCRRVECFYHLILAADCSTKYKTALRLNPARSILKLFTSTLDSQVFPASLSPWWISWAVERSPGRPQLHAELSCLCCRAAATQGYLGYHCLHVMCSYTQFWQSSLITLRWRGVAIQKKKPCVGFRVKVSHPAWGEDKGIS